MPPTRRPQTPTPGPVNAREPGAVAVVLALVDAAVEPPCVALLDWLPDDVVLAVGAGTKEIGTITCGSVDEESPYARTQESPAVTCAAVGGQG